MFTCGICVQFNIPQLEDSTPVWVDATLDLCGILEACDMIDLPIAAEDLNWEIIDCVGFGDYDVTGLNLDQINLIAETVNEAGCLAPIAWLQATGSDIKYIEQYTQDYVGQYDSEEDYAYEYINGAYNLDSFVKQYFDYVQFANDIFTSGDYVSVRIDGELHIFAMV